MIMECFGSAPLRTIEPYVILLALTAPTTHFVAIMSAVYGYSTPQVIPEALAAAINVYTVIAHLCL